MTGTGPSHEGNYIYKYKPRAAGKGFLDAYLAHFTSNPVRDGFIYGGLILVAVVYACICFAEHFIPTECGEEKPADPWPNPEYDTDPCLDRRYWQLLGLSPRECEHYRRLVVSLLLGSVIGYERRSPDRPAGIRTMSLVCLGSCSFTLSSQWAFQTSPMSWDAARVSASIPSGVGFLGSAIIWKGFVKDEEGDENHEIHGLHTAASIWIAAAVGVACGGGIYVPAAYTVLCLITMLRFGPRPHNPDHDEDDEDEEEDQAGEMPSRVPSQQAIHRQSLEGSSRATLKSLLSKSFRSKASLVA